MVKAKVDIHKAEADSLADKGCLFSDMASPRPDKVVPLHLGGEKQKSRWPGMPDTVCPVCAVLISGFAGEAPVVGHRSLGPRAWNYKSNQRARFIWPLILKHKFDFSL
jgi:hypothetical protein